LDLLNSEKAEQVYSERAEQLLKAIAISEDVIRASKAFSATQKRQLLAELQQTRTLASNPEPPFRNLRSLANLEQAVVQPWNEESSPDADAFWARSADAGLVYQRGKTLREPRTL
jgi:hypothetical protein